MMRKKINSIKLFYEELGFLSPIGLNGLKMNQNHLLFSLS